MSLLVAGLVLRQFDRVDDGNHARLLDRPPLRPGHGQPGRTWLRPGPIGGSNAEPEEVYPAGPWSAHTTGIAFTGDAWGTWNTLAAEVALTPAEATIGESYVSDDIGSYLGPPPTQSGSDPPDLYDRWVQFGTFQPILRLHSNDEDRLPWHTRSRSRTSASRSFGSARHSFPTRTRWPSSPTTPGYR